ncbi:MAG: hypothetical protein RR998_05090 [Oscillospiraceae bacterium]
MRKMLILIAAALILSVFLAGCSGQNAETPNTGDKSVIVSDKPTESTSAGATSSLLAGEDSESEESSNAPEQSSESVVSDAPQQKADTSSETQTVSESINTPAPKKEITPPSATEQPQQETPAPQPTSPPAIETPTPAPTEPPAPRFDVSTYISYAQGYGQSIGLSLDSTATVCWDDPLNANASCTYLERDLKDRLDWYKASGYTAFWVWSEDLGNGNYSIYVGYA